MSQTFTLTGTKSEIGINYHPPVELNEKSLYKLGLVGFYTYNSVPNIDEGLNTFYCVLDKKLKTTRRYLLNTKYRCFKKIFGN